jgi:hypothetical protein
MLLLPRLTSRSSRSLAVMLVCGQASRGASDWPARFPRGLRGYRARPQHSQHPRIAPLQIFPRLSQVVS